MSYLSTKKVLLLSEDAGPHKAESHGEDGSQDRYLPPGRRDTHEGGVDRQMGGCVPWEKSRSVDLRSIWTGSTWTLTQAQSEIFSVRGDSKNIVSLSVLCTFRKVKKTQSNLDPS